MGNSRDARQRARLYFQQNGRCHWCGCEMLLILGDVDKRDEPARIAIKTVRKLPYLATLDHLDSKLSGERGEHPFQGWRKVAACAKCNHSRAADEEARLPLEELRRRASGRYDAKSAPTTTY